MQDFLLLFRTDYKNIPKRSPEETRAVLTRWNEWFDSIAAQDKLAQRGNRLMPNSGKVVKPNNVVTDGPYMEIKESIGGFAIVKADSLEEATAFAKDCPIIKDGGSVEVREVLAV